MADRIPLIVNPDASQIQELPTNDKLLLSGHLEFNSNAAACGDIISSGGNDGIVGVFCSTSVSNSSIISINCRNNAGNGNLNVAEFKVGASNKIELVAKGEITAVQPTCLLTVPKPYTANNTEDPSNHIGGTNRKPISFTNTTTNVNCTTSLSSDATINSGITSITVPSAGTYLVSAMIGGAKTGGSGTDQIRFALSKTGIGTFPSSDGVDGDVYPTFIFGDNNQAEFHANFTLPVTLSASDTLSVHLSHIGASSASIQEGYFSVTKLH